MQELFNNYVQSLETYIMFRIKETVLKITPDLTAKGRSPINLSMGAPVAAPPKLITERLKQILDEGGIHTYSMPKGELFFREAIAKRMKTRFNVDLNPASEIFSLIGSKEGLANFIRIMINPAMKEEEKEIIFVPDPGYASYGEMVKVSGGLAYPLPLTRENNFMPDLENVWKEFLNKGYDPKKVKALIINYPNNPLGAMASKEYLQSTVDFCLKHNILLMSDAAYTDMYFNADFKPVSILEFDGARDIAVEFFSFSKPYALTGWRLGWVCGNEEAVKIFGKFKSTLDSGLFKALQKACAEILNSAEGDKYIEEANKKFKRSRDILVKALKEELNWGEFYIPNATFYLWLPIPPRYKSSVEFTDDLMHKSGIITVPGDAFGQNGKGFFRVSVVCPEEQIKEAAARMKKDGFVY